MKRVFQTWYILYQEYLNCYYTIKSFSDNRYILRKCGKAPILLLFYLTYFLSRFKEKRLKRFQMSNDQFQSIDLRNRYSFLSQSSVVNSMSSNKTLCKDWRVAQAILLAWWFYVSIIAVPMFPHISFLRFYGYEK